MNKVIVSILLFILYGCAVPNLGLFSQKKRFDIILDERELRPEITTYNAANLNNWGKSYVMGNVTDAIIEAAAKNKVWVKVFDTAYDFSHPALQKAKVVGEDYTQDNSTVDQLGHSSFVSGLYAADNENISICYGLIKKGLIKIQPIKVLNDAGSGSYEWIKKALELENEDSKRLIDAGWKVIYNFSLGGGTQIVDFVDPLFAQAIRYGVFVVAASGNESGPVSYPGNSDYTYCYSAIDSKEKIAAFSNTGKQIDFTNPGVSVSSTWRGNQYVTGSGTSYSTPIGGAVAALAYSLWDIDTPKDMYTYLSAVSNDLGDKGKDDKFGYGSSIVAKILATNPGDVDQEPRPDDPSNDPIERDERILTFPFSNPNWYLVWRKKGEESWKRIYPKEMTVQILSNHNAEYVLDELTKASEDYFSNRGLLLPDYMDFCDAGQYMAVFYRIILQRNNEMQVSITQMEAQSDGQACIIGEQKIKKSFFDVDVLNHNGIEILHFH